MEPLADPQAEQETNCRVTGDSGDDGSDESLQSSETGAALDCDTGGVIQLESLVL